MVILCIPGKPTPWRAHAGSGKTSFNPLYKERKEVQVHIKSQYTGPQIDSYVHISFIYRLAVPSSFSRKKKALALLGDLRPLRPDCTNMQKFYEDCLKGIVIKDDNIVTKTSSEKMYDSSPSVTMIIIIIEPNIPLTYLDPVSKTKVITMAMKKEMKEKDMSAKEHMKAHGKKKEMKKDMKKDCPMPMKK